MTAQQLGDALHFPGVMGHEIATAGLARAIARGRLHHALLVTGPVGVGKATFARGLACALHCTQAPGRGCGTCIACRRVLTGMHAGVEWIVPEQAGGTLKVEAARELGARLLHAPFEGEHHVVVFDPGDAWTEQAANALLKTIEEPRPGVTFALLVTHADAVLPTIRSRCQPVRLGPLPDETVAAIVDSVLARAEGETPDAAARVLAVRLAAGSPGQALALAADPALVPVLELARHALAATHAAAIFGGERSPLWVAWAEATAGPSTGRPARERAVLAQLCDLWLLHLRECMRGGAGLADLPHPSGNTARMVATVDRLLGMLEALLRNPNPRLSLEQLLLADAS